MVIHMKKLLLLQSINFQLATGVNTASLAVHANQLKIKTKEMTQSEILVYRKQKTMRLGYLKEQGKYTVSQQNQNGNMQLEVD